MTPLRIIAYFGDQPDKIDPLNLYSYLAGRSYGSKVRTFGRSLPSDCSADDVCEAWAYIVSDLQAAEALDCNTCYPKNSALPS